MVIFDEKGYAEYSSRKEEIAKELKRLNGLLISCTALLVGDDCVYMIANKYETYLQAVDHIKAYLDIHASIKEVKLIHDDKVYLIDRGTND